MSNPFDPLDPNDALDEEDLMSEELSDVDEAKGLDERTTPSEMRRPRSIEDALDEEMRDRSATGVPDEVLVDYDEPDEEGQLVADETRASDDRLAPEEAAIHTATEAPGATDDEDDGYGDAAG